MISSEDLFFKIFKNKFLRFKILGSIKLLPSNEYQDIENYKIGNRICFSDIRSIDFLLLKNQIPLLNDKLNSNSVINWGPNSIKILIEKCHDPLLFKRIYNLNKHQIQYKANLILHAVTFENIVALELFLQDSNEYTVLPTTFSEAIKYSSPLILSKLIQCLINRNLSIFDYIDKNSIILDALLNKKYLDEMVSFILDFQNPFKLYVPISRSIPNFTMISTYSLKLRLVNSFSNQFYLDPPNYKILSNVQQCLSYLQLFHIKQQSINYSLVQDELDKLKVKYNNSNDCNKEYIKQLRSIIFKQTGSNEFYNNYIEEYDCVIDEHIHTKQQLSLVHNYTFTLFSYNTLIFLISQNYDGSNDINNGRTSIFESNKKFLLKDENRIIQFFNLYYQDVNFNIVKVNKWYEIIKFIILNCSISTLESIKEIKSFPINHFLLVKHSEIIDPIKYDWYLKSILFGYHNQNNITQINSIINNNFNGIFNPHSLELLQYIESKLSIKFGQKEYIHLLNYSFLNCDTETIKLIIDLLDSSDSFNIFQDDGQLVLFKPDDSKKIQSLFKYLNDEGFSKFNDKIFTSLIIKLSKSKLSNLQLQSISINFNLFKFNSIKLLIEFIVKLELDNVNLIFNNQIPFNMEFINDISFKSQIDEFIIQIIKENRYSICNTTFKVYNGYKSDVLKMIQLLITNDQLLQFCNVYSQILNYLIKRFIQCNDTTLYDIHNLYDQLKEISIPFSNDPIYIFYYFTIKSTKFLKFFNNILNTTSYNTISEKSYIENLLLLLPSSIFTFDMVKNSSFKSLFLELYYHLNQFQNIDIKSSNIIKKSQDVDNKSNVNNDIKIKIFNYLMSIGQVDLILDIIFDTHLNDKEESIKIISEIINPLITIISIDQFESLYQNGIISIETSLSNAIQCSNFKIIKYILSNGYYTNSGLPDCQSIYKNCENDVIIYLYSNFCQLFNDDQITQCFNISFSLGNLEITQFLISIFGVDKFKLTHTFIQKTMEIGYSDIVKFYYENDFVGITFENIQNNDILQFISSLKISYYLPWVKKN